MACGVRNAECGVDDGPTRNISSRWVLITLLLIAYCLLPTAGCVRRTLTIRSEPDGAELLVNDTRLGTTPYSYDFVWYGWHRITLRKSGYEQLDDRVFIKAPFYLWIPFDFVMELSPMTVKDAKELSYHLTPQTPLVEPIPPTSGASSNTQAVSGSAESPPSVGTSEPSGGSNKP